MAKYLLVGDPHVQISNLEESQKILDFVTKTALEESQVTKIIFMGDLFHTHAVLRVEVVDFWIKNIKNMVKVLSPRVEIIALVGNHDQPGSREKEGQISSLVTLESTGVRVINSPSVIDGDLYMPYFSDRELFVSTANGFSGIKRLFAHQTFTGATYENGFYAEDGIDPALINIPNIYSGHIHKAQQVGKCFYVGTPKWDTLSDANQDKYIWTFNTHTETLQNYTTSGIVTPIVSIDIREESCDSDLDHLLSVSCLNTNLYTTLIGSSSWVSKIKKRLPKEVKVKVKITDKKAGKVDLEDLGDINNYISKFYKLPAGITFNEITEMLQRVE